MCHFVVDVTVVRAEHESSFETLLDGFHAGGHALVVALVEFLLVLQAPVNCLNVLGCDCVVQRSLSFAVLHELNVATLEQLF